MEVEIVHLWASVSKNINNDSEEEQSAGNLEQDDEEEEEENDTSPSSTESGKSEDIRYLASRGFHLVNTRIRNSNLQSRARELLNKKDSKKSDHFDSEETENNSTLNRTLLPDYDGVVYTLDAKLIGNIGRYFNHSCSPNIAVQNVFVDVSSSSPLASVLIEPIDL